LLHLTHLWPPVFFHLWSSYFKLLHSPLSNQPLSFSFCFQVFQWSLKCFCLTYLSSPFIVLIMFSFQF
jgi:hypothetical protein